MECLITRVTLARSSADCAGALAPVSPPKYLALQVGMDIDVVFLAQHDQIRQVVATAIENFFDMVHNQFAEASLRLTLVLCSAVIPLAGEMIPYQAAHPLLFPFISGTLPIAYVFHCVVLLKNFAALEPHIGAPVKVKTLTGAPICGTDYSLGTGDPGGTRIGKQAIKYGDQVRRQ